MSSHYGGSHFASSHFLSSHYGRTVVPPTPPDFTPDPLPPTGSAEISADLRRRIMEEEELLMLVVRAFLHVRNRD